MLFVLSLLGIIVIFWAGWNWQSHRRLWPARSQGEDAPFLAASSSDGVRSAPDVTLWGRPVGRCTAPALAHWLQELAPSLQREAQPAAIDDVTGGNVPGLHGLELDVAATVQRVLAAPPGGTVLPFWRVMPAPVALEDLPPGPLWQSNPQRREVTMLVNVAWGNEHLPAMLDIFAYYGVQTTFFLVGAWAEKYPDLAQAIARRHEVANHGWDAGASGPGHLGPAALRDHITAGARAITAATGRPTAFFSPHKGELTPRMGAVAADVNHQLVHWSIDTVDWRDPAPAVMVARVLDRLHGGALILMHPRAVTVAALPPMLEGIYAAGYRVVPLSTLISPELPAHLVPRPPAEAAGPACGV